jgi:predicted nucleic acid-binding protein
MSDRAFVDTNVLVYAHDLDAGNKHEVAAKLISQLWDSRNGVLSTQVLQECYVTLTKKVVRPLGKMAVRRLLQSYFSWEIAVNDLQTILQASEIEEAHNLSFWDALIVAAASSKNVTLILTEDLNHGQIIEGILVQNPFLS